MTRADHQQSAKVTTPSEREIRTDRIFNAPRERVWKALTDRDGMLQSGMEVGLEQSYRALDEVLVELG